MEARRLCWSNDNLSSRDVFEEHVPLVPVNMDSSLSKINLHVVDISTGTTSLSVREYEFKISHLKRRLTLMQEENTCLVQENSQLIGELEAVQLELASSKTKVSVLGSSIECKTTNVCQMTKEIEGLEAEVQAQGDALKDAEIIQANNKETITKNSQLIASLKNELRVLGDELKDRANQTNRAEKQRDEALANSKKQILALHEQNVDISDKLKKVLDSETILKQALINCDKERESWVQKCCQLEQENANMNRLDSQLRKDMETMQAESAVLRSQLEVTSVSGLDLQKNLREKEEVEKGFEEMKRKNKSLRKLTRTQEQQLQQLQQCQLEVEQSTAKLASLEAIHKTGVEDHKAQLATLKATFQSAVEGGKAELASLEAILNLLHLREDGSLCARPCLPSPDHLANVPNLIPGEGYRQLLPALQTVVQEGNRQAALALILDEKLLRAQEEMSVLRSGTVQQDHQLHTLHTAMQERAAHTYHLETEVERLNKCFATSDRQREEMAMVLSRALEKNSELNQSLLEKNSRIQHFKDVLEAMKKDLQRTLEERQAVYAEKCKELEEQIQTVQLRESRIAALEEDLISAQHERKETQLTAEALQDSVTLKVEMKAKEDQETLIDVQPEYIGKEKNIIQHYEYLLKTKEKDFQQASEDFQRAHTEKCKELGEQIQSLEECMNQRDTQIASLEKHLSSARREREVVQCTAETLQESLTKLTRERERKNGENQEALRVLQVQAVEYTDKVRFLETSLATCNNELNSCTEQNEAAKKWYETDIHWRDRKLDLQSTIERQRSILLDNASSVAELLEEKAGLLEQINHLEKELAKEKAASKELEIGNDAVSKELKREKALASKEVEREKELALTDIERQKILASNELENEKVQASKELEKIRMQASKELKNAREQDAKELAEEKTRFDEELKKEKVLAAKMSEAVIELASQELQKEGLASKELKEAISCMSIELERVKMLGSKALEEEKALAATQLEKVKAEAVKELEKTRQSAAKELEKEREQASKEFENVRALASKDLENLITAAAKELENLRVEVANELEKEKAASSKELERSRILADKKLEKLKAQFAQEHEERIQAVKELEKERMRAAQELEKERMRAAQELEKERMRAAQELEKEREQAVQELEQEKALACIVLQRARVLATIELEQLKEQFTQKHEKERMHAAQELEKERMQAAKELQERGQAAQELEKEKAAVWKELERARASASEELAKQRMIAAEELKEVEQIAQESCQLAVWHEKEALQLSDSVMQLTENMSKVRGELTEREQELLKIRRDSDTKAAELVKMEKMLQDTKSLLDKKTEPGVETKGLQENMVEDLEQKVRVNRRERRNSLHHTQMLESQMKTVRGELEDTLDHLQELRNKLRRSQKKAEERQAAMEKLAAGMSDSQSELEQTSRELQQKNEEVRLKDAVLSEKQEEILKLQKALQLNQKEVETDDGKEDKLTLIGLQSALEASRRESQERNKQVEFLSERLDRRRSQLQGKESMEEVALSRLHEHTEKLQQVTLRLEEMESVCETLKLQLEQSVQFGLEKESEAQCLMQKLSEAEKQAAEDKVRLQITVSTLREELDTLKKLHQKELSGLRESQAETLKTVSSPVPCSQDPSSHDLEQTRVQLGQAQNNVTSLLAELQTREEVLSRTCDALSVKESEISDLKTKISSLQRSSESYNITLDSGLAATSSLNDILTRTTLLPPTQKP